MHRMLSYATLLTILVLSAQPSRGWAIQDSPRPLKPRQEQATAAGWHAEGTRGAVSAGGAEAVHAGMLILKNGGNAADAAVATILALSVTDAGLFCFGGEVPIMVYNAKRGVTEVIAGQGVAPRLATREHFAPHGPIPVRGIEVATVPAVLDACLVALERHGSRRFSEVAAPALMLLERDQEPWHAQLRATLFDLITTENSTSDRSLGYQRVADYFYRGPIARRIDTWARASGALIRYDDLATHVTRVEEPVRADFRGFTVLKCGPWTQGLALLQSFQILDPVEMLTGNPCDPKTIHTVTESLKLAFADRDQYYADPLFSEVPIAQLLDPAYAKLRRTLVDPEHASWELRPGDPVTHQVVVPVKPRLQTHPNQPSDTTTCLVADAWGNVVAATPSGWSGVPAGDTGVWLGSRLQSFRIDADHPNVIQPGKRPRITLTPTLVLKNSKPILAVRVAGADLQDQVSLQILLDHLVFGKNASESVTLPRYSTGHYIGSFAQTPPQLGTLTLQSMIAESTGAELSQRGHTVQRTEGIIGAPSVLVIDPVSRKFEAAGDPRAGRHAAAY